MREGRFPRSVVRMTHTTEPSTAPRDIDAELLALHGSTIDRGYAWRTAQMPDQSMRIEMMVAGGEHHMTTKMHARRRAALLGCVVGKFLKLTHLRGSDGLPQTRRVYELNLLD